MIYKNKKSTSLYQGGYRPVTATYNGIPLAGYETSGITGEEGAFINTYLAPLSVFGKSGYLSTETEGTPSLANLRTLVSSQASLSIEGKNLFYPAGTPKQQYPFITVEWDAARQTVILDGEVSTDEVRSGYNLILSEPFEIPLAEGTPICNTRYLKSGSCTLSDGAYLLWSVFSVGTTTGTYYAARITESSNSQSIPTNSETGVVPVKTGQGYRYVLQLLLGEKGRVRFDRAAYQIQIEKGIENTAFLPHRASSYIELPVLRGLATNGVPTYSETENGMEARYYSDSVVGDRLTRRVGVHEFSPNDSIDKGEEWENTVCFYLEFSLDPNRPSAIPLCNAFLWQEEETDSEGIGVNKTTNRIYVRLLKTRGITSISDMAIWLEESANKGQPLTLYYPLANPEAEVLEKGLFSIPQYTEIKVTNTNGVPPLGLKNCILVEKK